MPNVPEMSYNSRKQGLLSFPKFMMTMVGFWPKELIENEMLRKFYHFYSIFIKSLYALVLTSMAIKNFILLTNSESMRDISSKVLMNLACLVTWIIIQLRVIFYSTTKMRKIISYILEAEQHLLQLDDANYLSCYWQESRYCSKANVTLCACATTLYLASFYDNTVQSILIEQYNRKNNATLQKPFIYDLYYWKMNVDKYQLFALIVNDFSAIVAVIMGLSAEALILGCISFVIIMIKILQVKIKNFVYPSNDTKWTIKKIVEEHYNCIRLVKNLNDVLKIPLLVEYILLSFNMAIILMLYIRAERFAERGTTAGYCVGLTIYVFFLGWSASGIKMESLALSDAIYESPWFEKNSEIAKIMTIMIMRTQKPLILTIGSFGEMTLNSFLTIMKATYSYATLMMQ
ncbi:odorant receptor 49b-like isoform X2 [Cylas formicarius]|uniref:odorant receptor 49b-like isoform X2 n=1 Tax=Cylas formicarius TaxID=197179 RepID=UPI002958A74A|nr:odorant receptor 49b-like isoform X2 [Cylas formicarius]XP_060530114.1 odorant receptor 49b-like isoform X2 [Cylas formicarius]